MFPQPVSVDEPRTAALANIHRGFVDRFADRFVDKRATHIGK